MNILADLQDLRNKLSEKRTVDREDIILSVLDKLYQLRTLTNVFFFFFNEVMTIIH